MSKKLKVVNIFGGPGTGKSTTRAELFALFKKGRHNVEEVTEFAKDLTWEKNQTAFADQLFLLANQNRRQFRLQDQVEWCVTDSPILLGVNYVTPEYLPYTFRSLSFELWNTYDNYNFFIERATEYQSIGRNQTEDEAKQIDRNILEMLHTFQIPFKTVRGEGDVAKVIYNEIMIDGRNTGASDLLDRIRAKKKKPTEEDINAIIDRGVEKVFKGIGEFKGFLNEIAEELRKHPK